MTFFVAGIIFMILFTAGPVFLVALLIEKLLLKPGAGKTRIFMAMLMAAPVVGSLWGLMALLIDGKPWQLAIGTAVIGYLGALVPAFIRWQVVRRRSAKLNANAATTFE